MKEKKAVELTEEHLINTTGGDNNGGGNGCGSEKCGFVHAGGKTTVRLRDDGRYESYCDSTCYTLKFFCPCNGTSNCVNRWHIVTENGSPLPNNVLHQHWYS